MLLKEAVEKDHSFEIIIDTLNNQMGEVLVLVGEKT